MNQRNAEEILIGRLMQGCGHRKAGIDLACNEKMFQWGNSDDGETISALAGHDHTVDALQALQADSAIINVAKLMSASSDRARVSKCDK